MSKKVITRVVFDFKTKQWVEEQSYDYDGPWSLAGPPAQYHQTAWAFYEDDGDEANSTQIGSDTTTQSIDVDTNFQCRIRMEEQAARADTFTTPIFQYNLAGGGWNAVTTSSSVLIAVDSTHLASNDDPSERINTPTPVATSFVLAGNWVSEDGTLPSFALGSEEYCEALLSCSIVSGDVTNGQQIEVRITSTDPVPSSWVTAKITVNEAAGGRRRSNTT